MPFSRGERLNYKVYYKTFLGKIYAGEIVMEIKNTRREFNGHDTFHLECVCRTRHSFHWIMNVEDRFESYIDEKSMLPWLFIRQVREGSYEKDEEVEFFPDQQMAKSKTGTKQTPSNVQDILSAFYFPRTSDVSNLKPGDSFQIPIFLDDSVYTSAIIFKDKEIAKTHSGNFNCMKFTPMVVTGRVFSNRYPMTVWISDDKEKIPIFIESSLSIGKLEVELSSTSGLANPLKSKIN